MQAVQQTAQTPIRHDLTSDWTEEINCVQTREIIDALFSRKLQLATAHKHTKQHLFSHLKNCEACCRSFDARILCNSFSGRGIY